MIDRGSQFLLRRAASTQLGPNEVHVHIHAFNGLKAHLQVLASNLAADERKKASQFLRSIDAERYSLGRGMLRAILSAYLGVPADGIQFCYNPWGKPALPRASLNFNLSHSATYLAIAISDLPVGIDVEELSLCREDFELIARVAFAENEFLKLLSLPKSSRDRAFVRCWTQKEAYMKARGDGLNLAPTAFETAVLPEDAPGISAQALDVNDSGDWNFAEKALRNGHISVASQSWKVSWYDHAGVLRDEKHTCYIP